MQSREAKGKGNEFVRQTVAVDQVQDARPLELLLFETEHCWASAEELWAQQDTSDTPRSVLRRRSIARGRRAVQNAEQLQTLVDALPEHLDIAARAQCAAYVGLVRSAMLFIKGHWEETLKHCSVTRELLTSIAECAPTSRDEALASSFLDALDAQVRFAAYSLGDTEQDTSAVAARVATPETCEAVIPHYAQLTKELKEAHGSRSHDTAPLELHWREHTIPVHSFELHDAVTRVNEEEAQLAAYLASSDEAPRARSSAPRAPRTRLSHAARNAKRRGGATAAMRPANTQRANHGELDPFDRVLGALSDAEEAVRLLVEENAQALQKSHSARYEAAGLDLRRAHEFLMYRLLSVRIARNMRLVDEVQAKAAKREDKARQLLAKRERQASAAPPSHTPPPSQKRAGPGSRAKRVRATSKAVQRKPGRSGTRALAQKRRAAAAQRACDVAAAKTDRRSVRIVPGLAKLLENVDSSLLAIGGLVMIEGEPDVSSLMEAKRFYYSAVLLGHLARAFFQHALHAEALLLLQRGELYVRQASQALELADGAEDQDVAFAPELLGKSDALEAQQDRLMALRDEVVAAVQSPAKRRHTPASLRDTKSGQTLYYQAQRHVSFDPEDLSLALEQARATEGAMEVDEAEAEGVEDLPPPSAAPAAPEPVEQAADDPSVPFGAYDPGNAMLEEEEAAAAAASRSRSWLGGWFRST